MGKGRILIIVSYNGIRHQSGYNAYQLLRIQHKQLTDLKHSLDKILIVVNESGVEDEDYEKALALFPNLLRRPNTLWSYGGWKDGVLANPDYEWYFFLEDDYTVFMDDWDQKWIDLWKPEMSYLAHKVGTDWGYPKHASMSSGLSRGDILKTVKWENLRGSGEYDAILQVSWSQLFDSEGLFDIRSRYAAPFHSAGTITNHGDIDFPILIGPAQMLEFDQPTREVMWDRHKRRMEEDIEYKFRVENS